MLTLRASRSRSRRRAAAVSGALAAVLAGAALAPRAAATGTGTAGAGTAAFAVEGAAGPGSPASGRALEAAPWRLLRDGAPAAGPAADPRREAEAARRAAVARREEELLRGLGPHQVSRRSLARLAERGLGPALLAPGAKRAQPAADTIDTLRVLLVRISFAADRTGDLTSVTTDGDFQLVPDDTTLIDPPPHDRAFFEAHLAGLAEYYTWQSHGRLVIDGRVLPPGDRDSYQLSDIADYGPVPDLAGHQSGAASYWNLEGLERLVRDMIQAADAGAAGDGVDFSAYGDDRPFTYVIFVHAGADWQSDVDGDSPNDIPTFFVSLGEGEPLDGGGTLTECSIIPETTSQDGWLGSIAAGLYHEFGHALGLADIYSTRTGAPQVGYWSLMDSGTNLAARIAFAAPTQEDPDAYVQRIVVGLLPPSLGAWDKWFLGWVRPADVAGGTSPWRLPAVQVPRSQYGDYRAFGHDFDGDDPQVLVGGTSSREFFLVENRWVPYSGAELPASGGDPYNVFLVRDAGTGVVLFLGADPDGDAGPAPLRNTGMYDWFLPDGGLLVWHANAARIDEGLAPNTVNWYGDGLRLVEADGIQDIGYYGGYYGSETEPFHAERPEPERRRGFAGDQLLQEGAPSSRAFDRSWTGFELRGISLNEALMTGEGGLAPLVPGTPRALAPLTLPEGDLVGGPAGPRALAPRSLTPFPLGGEPALVFADAPRPAMGDTTFWTTLFAVRPDGAPVDPAPPFQQPPLPGGGVLRLPAELAGPPLVIAPAGGAGVPPLLVCARRDGVVTIVARDLGAGGHVQALDWSRRVGHALPWAPAAGPLPAGGDLLLACVPPDSLVLCNGVGQLVGAPLALSGHLGLAVREFVAAPLWLGDGEAGPRFAVFTDIGWCPVEAGPAGLDAASLALQPYGLDAAAAAGLARASLPGSPPRLLVFGPGGEARAWEERASGWAPAVWAGSLDAAPAGEPAVADVDGDGRLDLALATPRRLFAFQADGVPLRGFPAPLGELFPLADSTRFAGDVVVVDGDGDGRAELFAATNLGHLIGLDATGRLLPRLPLLWGDPGGAGLAVAPGPGQARTLWLAAPGGRTGPPLDRRWIGGRLAGYALAEPAAGVLRSAEWLGPGGGAGRRGPEGVLTDLGSGAPAAAEIGRVIAYPNPTRDRQVTVRFYSGRAAPARARLFSLEGELVAEQAWTTVAGQVNERPWSLPGLASGVYLLQVEADFGSGSARRLLQLAVE